MKKKTLKYISALLILVVSVMSLASCVDFDTILGYQGGGSETPTLPSTGDNITNNITIQGDGANLTAASNKGL